MREGCRVLLPSRRNKRPRTYEQTWDLASSVCTFLRRNKCSCHLRRDHWEKEGPQGLPSRAPADRTSEHAPCPAEIECISDEAAYTGNTMYTCLKTLRRRAAEDILKKERQKRQNKRESDPLLGAVPTRGDLRNERESRG